MKLIVATLLFCCLTFSVLSDDVFTATKMHNLVRVGAPIASSKYIAYTVNKWNQKENKKSTNIEALPTSNLKSDPIAFTQAEEGVSDFSITFGPDGSQIGFLSNRRGSIQVFIADGTDVKQVTKFPDVEIENLKWAPNGKYFIATIKVYPDCDTLACTAERDQQVAARGSNSWRVFDSLYVRHWDQWETGKQSHLFAIRINENQEMIDAEPIDIMKELPANCPVPPFGGSEQFNIAPDSSGVALTLEEIRFDTAWTTGWRVFFIPFNVASGEAGEPIELTDKTVPGARAQDPTFINAFTIVFHQMDRPFLESDKLHLNVYDLTAGRIIRKYGTNFDRSFDTATAKGRYIYATAADNGRRKVFRIDQVTQDIQVVIEDGANGAFVSVPGRDNLFVYSKSSSKHPGQVYLYNINTKEQIQLTHYNDEALSQVKLSTPETYYFQRAGYKIQAWVWKPTHYTSGKKYPVVQLIHGGPEGAWDDSWSFRWNPQLWAAAGFAVVAINPRGSTGFGQNFTDAVRNDWGGEPFLDLTLGITRVVQNYSNFMSQSSLVACGASYGGYMINWINGNAGNQYKALVNHDGVFDTMSMYYSTEELFFNEAEFGGKDHLPAFKDPEAYNKFNPRNHVNTMNTPMLVIHGGHDFRIPLAQGLGAFTALQRRQVDSKLLYFEKENHWVLDRLNSIKWYDEVLGWCSKYSQ